MSGDGGSAVWPGEEARDEERLEKCGEGAGGNIEQIVRHSSPTRPGLSCQPKVPLTW